MRQNGHNYKGVNSFKNGMFAFKSIPKHKNSKIEFPYQKQKQKHIRSNNWDFFSAASNTELFYS